MKRDVLDGLVSNRKPDLLQTGETLQTAVGQSSGVSFEGLLFYSATGVAPDLAMQALKLINNLDVWQIWFEALPQDCTVVMLIQPVRPAITDTCLQGSGATFIFLIPKNKDHFPMVSSYL